MAGTFLLPLPPHPPSSFVRATVPPLPRLAGARSSAPPPPLLTMRSKRVVVMARRSRPPSPAPALRPPPPPPPLTEPSAIEAAAFCRLLIAATDRPSKAAVAALRAALAARPSLAAAPLAGGVFGGSTPLAVAANVLAGAPAVVAALLEAGAPVDGVARSGDRSTPLCIAARRASAEVVAMLLAAGANVNVKSPDKTTPLLIAAEKGSPAVLAAVLAARPPPDIRAVNGKGNPALVLAIENKATAIALLIKKGADVNVSLDGGWSVLMNAAQLGKDAHVEALLKAHAAVNVVADGGWTALLLAASRERWTVVDTLLRAGADPSAAEWKTQTTALHMAANAGDVATVRALAAALATAAVARGEATTTPAAGLNPRCQDGSTPLMLAAHVGKSDAVAALLDAGAAVDAVPRRDGNNALHCGVHGTHERVVRLLLHHGASVHARTTVGFTPLHLATEQLCLPLVRALLLEGADVAATTPLGDTALHLAASWGGHEVALELLAWGANPRALNNSGSTPAGEAATEQHVELERLLIAKAAEWTPETAATAAAAAKAAAAAAAAASKRAAVTAAAKAAAAAAAKATAAAARTDNHEGGPLVTPEGVDSRPSTLPATKRSSTGGNSRAGPTPLAGGWTPEAAAAAAVLDAASDVDDEGPVEASAGMDTLLGPPLRHTQLSFKDATAAWSLIDRDVPPPPPEAPPQLLQMLPAQALRPRTQPPPTSPPSTPTPPTTLPPWTGSNIVDARSDEAAGVTPPPSTGPIAAAESPTRSEDMDVGGGDAVSGYPSECATETVAAALAVLSATTPSLPVVASAESPPPTELDEDTGGGEDAVGERPAAAVAGTVEMAATPPELVVASATAAVDDSAPLVAARNGDRVAGGAARPTRRADAAIRKQTHLVSHSFTVPPTLGMAAGGDGVGDGDGDEDGDEGGLGWGDGVPGSPFPDSPLPSSPLRVDRVVTPDAGRGMVGFGSEDRPPSLPAMLPPLPSLPVVATFAEGRASLPGRAVATCHISTGAAAGAVAGPGDPLALVSPRVSPSPTVSAGATTSPAGPGPGSPRFVPDQQLPPSPVDSLLRSCAAPTADGAPGTTAQEDVSFRLGDVPPLSLAPAVGRPASEDADVAAASDRAPAAAGRLPAGDPRPRSPDGTGGPAGPLPSAHGTPRTIVQEDTAFVDVPPLSTAAAMGSTAAVGASATGNIAVDASMLDATDLTPPAAVQLSVGDRRPRSPDNDGGPTSPPPSSRPAKTPRLSNAPVAIPPTRALLAMSESAWTAVSPTTPAPRMAGAAASMRSLSETTHVRGQPCNPADVIVLDDSDDDSSPLPPSQTAVAEAVPRRFLPRVRIRRGDKTAAAADGGPTNLRGKSRAAKGPVLTKMGDPPPTPSRSCSATPTTGGWDGRRAARRTPSSTRGVVGPAGATNASAATPPCPCPSCKKLSPAGLAAELASRLSSGHAPPVVASLRRAITHMAEKEMISGAAAVAAEDPDRLAHQLLSSFRRRRDGGPPQGLVTLAHAYLCDINGRERLVGREGALPVCAGCSVGGGWAGVGVKGEPEAGGRGGGRSPATASWGGHSGSGWRGGRGGGGG